MGRNDLTSAASKSDFFNHRCQRRRGRPVLTTPQYLGTNWYFYKVYHTTTLQSSGHMNLKNNTPRMHHITPFEIKRKFTLPPRRLYTAPRFSRLRRSTCDPANVPVALTPMLSGVRCIIAYGPADATATHYLLLLLIQIGFTFLVPGHPGSPGQKAVKWVCVCLK